MNYYTGMITIHSPRTTKQKHAQIKRGINRLKKGLCKESNTTISWWIKLTKYKTEV